MTVFDQPASIRINKARQEAILRFLNELRGAAPIKTALDVGCGVGLFSQFLSELGLDVTGVEARSENVAEARRRYPSIRFVQYDVEDPTITRLDAFDLVLCTGLLYHLENPFRAIRNITALTRTYAVIETVVAPGSLPTAVLFDECISADQGLNYVALIPSERALLGMFKHAGLDYFYRPAPLPGHPDFRATLIRRKQRVLLVGSRVPLKSQVLREIRPAVERFNPWEYSRAWTAAWRFGRRVFHPRRGLIRRAI